MTFSRWVSFHHVPRFTSTTIWKRKAKQSALLIGIIGATSVVGRLALGAVGAKVD